MSAKNVPLHLTEELSAEIRRISNALNLPQSQCMRLSIQYGLPELERRLSRVEKDRVLPAQSKKQWSLEQLAQIDLDAPIDLGDLNEDIL